MTTYAHQFPSSLGPLFTAVDASGRVVTLLFAKDRSPSELAESLSGEVVWSRDRCMAVETQVMEYLGGDRRVFDLEVDAEGSEFQHQVWRELRRIPYGETRSYGEIANLLGRPGASRAVGRANATNPICLLNPCHRVIAADGSLAGFGGGVEIKRALLHLETGRPAQRDLFQPPPSSD